MRKNLFTESQAQMVVRIMPTESTTSAVKAMTCASMMVSISGSYWYRAIMPIPNTTRAMKAESSPNPTAMRRNGSRMKPHEAPTSFIVCIANRRA